VSARVGGVMFAVRIVSEFPKFEYDEDALYKKACASFVACVENLKIEDSSEYSEWFGSKEPNQFSFTLIKLAHVKYNHNQPLLGFDGSTPFHVEVHIQAYDSVGVETEVVAGYVLVLNQNLEVVDDFLR